MANNNKFFLEVDDLLGFKYQSYISTITSLSLSSPADYYALRKKVLDTVKVDCVKNMYSVLFSVLSSGKDKNGDPIGKLGTGDFVPAYPSNKINDLCLTIANDLADHINRVVDIILPKSFDKLSEASLTLKGKASLLT